MRCYGCMEIIEDGLKECPLCGFETGTKAVEIIHLNPGIMLCNDRYVLGKVIGCGGFGVTYIAWDTMLEKKVAIKEFLPSEFTTRVTGTSEITIFTGTKGQAFREGLSKFVEEANKLATFSNIDGIVKIYDCFEENQTAYIVMEYLEGETLETKLKREKKMEADDAISLMLPIMKALAQVHNLGIIHRDIAPDNIFITSEGKAKLLDFGSARKAQAVVEESRTVIVKKGYSPEEQYVSRSTQEATTDVYAMAATLYRTVTGEVPPDALERRMCMNSSKKDLLVDISRFTNKIDKNICKAIQNAMNVDMKKRTPDMEHFIDELVETKVKRKKTKEKTNNRFLVFIGQLNKKQRIIVASAIGACICIVALLLVIAPWKNKENASLYASEDGSGIDNGVIQEKKSDTEEAISDAALETESPDALTDSTDLSALETANSDGTVTNNESASNATNVPSPGNTSNGNVAQNTANSSITSKSTTGDNSSNPSTAEQNTSTGDSNVDASSASQSETQKTDTSSQTTAASTQSYTEIRTVSQLEAIKNNLSGNYKLMSNISVTSTYGFGSSTAPFTGTFDGNGKTITINEGATDNRKNITFSGSSNKGLFNYCTGTIKNLNMKGNMSYTASITKGSVDAYIVIGPICARVMNGGMIQNCTSDVIVNIVGTDKTTSYTTHLQVGGICGYVEKGTVDGCTFYATASNYLIGYSHIRTYTGGIVGKGLNATISNCKTAEYKSVMAGEVTASISERGAADRTSIMYSGGIAGYGSSTKVLNCSAKCHISCNPSSNDSKATDIYAAGVIGFKYGTCDVSGSTYDTDSSNIIVAQTSNIVVHKGTISGN